ncbi:ATP synthase F1 subcomplex delta subunit [Anseongella ginsenosidimutans]|uniref:ATP synthase subunit delta n=1 Tax=Anseongella ginsenosidimutans TaxID=496056 RepID=A0A4R3L162_9SPHI|nr:ATP synthase F1 subunit delta [Anseongella ginsenosidimutans]QEC51185.1 ATP synthase F1 subunit delta [Anseongella ginsenosidimutans]TCS90142.1 ATP synthase F1 subcomplex delta subunit [Anseongella ginsenosidimutans]
MAESKVSARYAKSLLDLAIEQNSLEEVKKDMSLFYDTLAAHPQLRAVLSSPVIDGDDKQGILHKLFEGKINKLSLAFFDIMIRKNREVLLYDTAKQFFEQYNKYKGIVKASVVSASALTGEQLEKIGTIIKQITPGEVQLENKIDTSLIGGFILNVGDKQYDASIARKLGVLKQELTSRFYESKI